MCPLGPRSSPKKKQRKAFDILKLCVHIPPSVRHHNVMREKKRTYSLKKSGEQIVPIAAMISPAAHAALARLRKRTQWNQRVTLQEALLFCDRSPNFGLQPKAT